MKKAIYKITNKINSKIYIGQSLNPEERFKSHCYKSQDKCLIDRAIKKYGKENFLLEILGWYENYNDMEKYFIKQFSSLAPYGYNIQKGGEEPPRMCGEDNPAAKISKEISENIIRDLQNWKIPRKQIIKKYKISYDLLRHINEGDSWKKDELKYPIRPDESEIYK